MMYKCNIMNKCAVLPDICMEIAVSKNFRNIYISLILSFIHLLTYPYTYCKLTMSSFNLHVTWVLTITAKIFKSVFADNWQLLNIFPLQLTSFEITFQMSIRTTFVKVTNYVMLSNFNSLYPLLILSSYSIPLKTVDHILFF